MNLRPRGQLQHLAQQAVVIEGRLHHVEPLVLALLRVLAEAAPEFVPRDRIEAELWPQVHVTPASLRQVVKQARRLVGDDGRRQDVIQTRRGRGYRLVLPVERACPCRREEGEANTGGARE